MHTSSIVDFLAKSFKNLAFDAVPVVGALLLHFDHLAVSAQRAKHRTASPLPAGASTHVQHLKTCRVCGNGLPDTTPAPGSRSRKALQAAARRPCQVAVPRGLGRRRRPLCCPACQHLPACKGLAADETGGGCVIAASSPDCTSSHDTPQQIDHNGIWMLTDQQDEWDGPKHQVMTGSATHTKRALKRRASSAPVR